MTNDESSSSETRPGTKGEPGPRFVSPSPRPASGDEPARPAVPPQSLDGPREDPDLFASRYVPFDGGSDGTSQSRSVARQAVTRGNSTRRKGLTGSRYVPIDGAAALSARPSKVLLGVAAATGVAAIGLAMLWGSSSDSDGLTAGSLAGGVVGVLTLVSLVVWWLGTSRMAALMVVLCGARFSCVALGAIVIQASGDDAPEIGPSALENDFDLLYGQCEDGSDIACDLLYRTSWDGSIRSSFAQELTRDCGGRGLSGAGFCTPGLVDSSLENFAGEGAPGWAALVGSCVAGDMLACDLVITASPESSVGDTCGARRQSSSSSCRSQFGSKADD